MNATLRQHAGNKAFTIIELLTVMSIIVILIGLLVPALNRVRRYAKTVKQNAQFNAINVALEMFYTEHQSYPDSNAVDPTGQAYCGAMKLGEAMVGLDLMGYHPQSQFRRDGTATGAPTTQLYEMTGRPAQPNLAESLKIRNKYLPIDGSTAYHIGDLYHQGNAPRVGQFDPCSVVLCDVYDRTTHRLTGKRLGMPILYYKADVSKNSHDILNPTNGDNIYDFRDNHELVTLGKPDVPAFRHKLLVDPLSSMAPGVVGSRFYLNTRSEAVLNNNAYRPFKADTYILLSAGFDGEYGTADDIFNFDWSYRQ